MKRQGVKFCKKCNQRTPYDRMENREDSPIKCLVCKEPKVEAWVVIVDQNQINVIFVIKNLKNIVIAVVLKFIIVIINVLKNVYGKILRVILELKRWKHDI